MSAPGDGTSIWVTSDLAADQENYVATVHFTEDISHAFPTPESAVEYARAFLQAWGAAEYDAAVFAQLTQKLGMPADKAVRLLAHLRGRRRNPVSYTVGPITVEPGVSAFTGKPFIKCTVGALQWQWAGADVSQHAQHVLEVSSVVEYDTTYREFLVEMDIEPERALAVVQDIATFREEL